MSLRVARAFFAGARRVHRSREADLRQQLKDATAALERCLRREMLRRAGRPKPPA